MKFRKLLADGSLYLAGLIVGWYIINPQVGLPRGCNNGQEDAARAAARRYRFEGRVTGERLRAQPGFGHIYRIEVTGSPTGKPPILSARPYVVVGSQEELRGLEQRISSGTRVSISSSGSTFSLDGKEVVLPTDVQLISQSGEAGGDGR